MAAAIACLGTCAVAIACPAARAADRAASSVSTPRAAACASREALRTTDILKLPVRAHSRVASMAFRGRSSVGRSLSKFGNTRSAQSAAHIANRVWSVLFARSSIVLSILVTAILGFFIPGIVLPLLSHGARHFDEGYR